MKKPIYISLLAVSVNFSAGVIEHKQDQQRTILPWLTLSAVLLSLPWSKESNKTKQHTLWQSGRRKKGGYKKMLQSCTWGHDPVTYFLQLCLPPTWWSQSNNNKQTNNNPPPHDLLTSSILSIPFSLLRHLLSMSPQQREGAWSHWVNTGLPYLLHRFKSYTVPQTLLHPYKC